MGLTVLGGDGEGCRSPHGSATGPTAEHLEGLTGPGGTEASSLEFGEVGSSGDGEAGSVSFLSLSDTAVRALKVALKADLVAAVVSASDLSLMVMSAFMGFRSLL
jgi:hypothetical protein